MTALKRYLIFAHSRHFPKGGWKDLKGMADTEVEASALAGELAKKGFLEYQIVDTEDTERVILSTRDIEESELQASWNREYSEYWETNSND